VTDDRRRGAGPKRAVELKPALAGYTVAIIAGDRLGATGGVNADAAVLVAVTRASEVCIGIVCTGIVLASTDLGAAPRRLTALFANLSAEIMSRFTATLAIVGPELPDTQPVRRDSSAGSSPSTRSLINRLGNPRACAIIRRYCKGRWTACSLSWWSGRAVANQLVLLAHDAARQEAAVILQSLPEELRSPQEHREPAR
jgi:hypothetical protein